MGIFVVGLFLFGLVAMIDILISHESREKRRILIDRMDSQKNYSDLG